MKVRVSADRRVGWLDSSVLMICTGEHVRVVSCRSAPVPGFRRAHRERQESVVVSQFASPVAVTLTEKASAGRQRAGGFPRGRIQPEFR